MTVCWVVLVTASNPVFAITSEPALDTLRSMATAVRSLSYSGKLVYQRADVLANLAFQHDVVDGEEVARLRRLSGSPMERAQTGQSLIEASPGPNVLRQGYPLPGLLNAEIRHVLDAPYRLSLESEERVADRLAQIVYVEALDGHRHSYRFWVDQESSLLLKSQTLNADDQVLEQFEFSELTLGAQQIDVASWRCILAGSGLPNQESGVCSAIFTGQLVAVRLSAGVGLAFSSCWTAHLYPRVLRWIGQFLDLFGVVECAGSARYASHSGSNSGFGERLSAVWQCAACHLGR